MEGTTSSGVEAGYLSEVCMVLHYLMQSSSLAFRRYKFSQVPISLEGCCRVPESGLTYALLGKIRQRC